MRALVQRVSRAQVNVGSERVGAVGRGLLAFVGVHADDTPTDARYIADKIAHLRVFADEQAKMNRCALDIDAGVLVVSQFTLYGDVRRGRRPSFADAAPPDVAQPLVEQVCARLRETGVRVEEGVFGASMQVELVNDGPVTLLIESPGR